VNVPSKPQSGMVKAPPNEPWIARKRDMCRHCDHLPPSNIVIPSGHHYQHVCPSCGMVTRVYPSMRA